MAKKYMEKHWFSLTFEEIKWKPQWDAILASEFSVTLTTIMCLIPGSLLKGEIFDKWLGFSVLGVSAGLFDTAALIVKIL